MKISNLITASFILFSQYCFAQASQTPSKGKVQHVPTKAIIETPNKTQPDPPAQPSNNFYDGDQDGLDDNLENKLLERFRPYYKFSYDRNSQDNYRPTDVLYYLRCAELNTSS